MISMFTPANYHLNAPFDWQRTMDWLEVFCLVHSCSINLPIVIDSKYKYFDPAGITSQDSKHGFRTGCRNVSHKLRTLIAEMIFFNQSMLLLGPNHFLNNKSANIKKNAHKHSNAFLVQIATRFRQTMRQLIAKSFASLNTATRRNQRL